MPLQTQTQPNTPVITEPLGWLFFAAFSDGHYVEQTPEDKCLSRTDGTGSAFTDVLNYQDQSQLIAFELRHVDGKQAATVDLVHGYFIVNGTPLVLHNQHFDPTKYPLKLVYFREVRVEKDVTGTLTAGGSISEESDGIRHYVNRYFIGWETTVNGKNKQVTLAVG